MHFLPSNAKEIYIPVGLSSRNISVLDEKGTMSENQGFPIRKKSPPISEKFFSVGQLFPSLILTM